MSIIRADVVVGHTRKSWSKVTSALLLICSPPVKDGVVYILCQLPGCDLLFDYVPVPLYSVFRDGFFSS